MDVFAKRHSSKERQQRRPRPTAPETQANTTARRDYTSVHTRLENKRKRESPKDTRSLSMSGDESTVRSVETIQAELEELEPRYKRLKAELLSHPDTEGERLVSQHYVRLARVKELSAWIRKAVQEVGWDIGSTLDSLKIEAQHLHDLDSGSGDDSGSDDGDGGGNDRDSMSVTAVTATSDFQESDTNRVLRTMLERGIAKVWDVKVEVIANRVRGGRFSSIGITMYASRNRKATVTFGVRRGNARFVRYKGKPPAALKFLGRAMAHSAADPTWIAYNLKAIGYGHDPPRGQKPRGAAILPIPGHSDRYPIVLDTADLARHADAATTKDACASILAGPSHAIMTTMCQDLLEQNNVLSKRMDAIADLLTTMRNDMRTTTAPPLPPPLPPSMTAEPNA